jgi:Zn-dependent protease
MKIGKVRISGGALLALAAVYFFDTAEFALFVLAAALAHELGHFLACRALKLRLDCFEIEMWGLNLRVEGVLPYRADFIAALAGPFMSLLFSFFAAAIARHGGFEGGYVLAGLSFLFFFMNILPICPLDGGRALYALVASKSGQEKADKVCAVTGCALIFMVLCAGAYIFIRTRVNFTLLLVGAWLLLSYCQTGGHGIQSMRNCMSEVFHESKTGENTAKSSKTGPLHGRRVRADR